MILDVVLVKPSSRKRSNGLPAPAEIHIQYLCQSMRKSKLFRGNASCQMGNEERARAPPLTSLSCLCRADG